LQALFARPTYMLEGLNFIQYRRGNPHDSVPWAHARYLNGRCARQNRAMTSPPAERLPGPYE
jgi:hypothetical protein